MEILDVVTAAVGWQELWPILLIVVVLFGAKKIPELARGLGTGMKEFKKAVREASDEDEAKPDQPSAKKDPTSPGGNGSS